MKTNGQGESKSNVIFQKRLLNSTIALVIGFDRGERQTGSHHQP